jgi:hypothetical protein
MERPEWMLNWNWGNWNITLRIKGIMQLESKRKSSLKI